jgi:hypothetical protein
MPRLDELATAVLLFVPPVDVPLTMDFRVARSPVMVAVHPVRLVSSYPGEPRWLLLAVHQRRS